jgi:hypothetical protein
LTILPETNIVIKKYFIFFPACFSSVSVFFDRDHQGGVPACYFNDTNNSQQHRQQHFFSPQSPACRKIVNSRVSDSTQPVSFYKK